jgi:hypothetical protein
VRRQDFVSEVLSLKRWNRCQFLHVGRLLQFPLLMASLAGIALVPGLQGQRSTSTADSPERTAEAVGRNCTTDLCSTVRIGCASCIDVTITLPAQAWVTKTHCLTNADYPDDRPRHQLHEVPCGLDVSWSRFETPIVTATSTGVTIHTIYHNRSSNRARDIKVTADWYLLPADRTTAPEP